MRMQVPTSRRLLVFASLLAVLLLAISVPTAEARLEEIVVHSQALEGNLLGDSPDRNVTVYLPPGYDENPGMRYPVLYLLHGFTGNNGLWKGAGYLGNFKIAPVADALTGSGVLKPLIIVMADARNKYLGSWYVNSLVTGGWEDFMVRDLVGHIDASYRTLDQVESRGIAGHSMGGAGAMALAMKHPEIYSAVYSLSGGIFGLVDPENSAEMGPNIWKTTLQLTQASQFGGASLFIQIQIAMAAALTPNPDNTPFPVDFPYELVDGQVRAVDERLAAWRRQLPLGILDQHLSDVARLHAITLDVGNADAFTTIPVDNRAFSAALTAAGIEHTFEVYDGDHLNRIAQRIEQKVLPFFSETLEYTAKPTVVDIISWGLIKTGFLERIP